MYVHIVEIRSSVNFIRTVSMEHLKKICIFQDYDLDWQVQNNGFYVINELGGDLPDPPDPYVKVYLMPGKKKKKKTEVVKVSFFFFLSFYLSSLRQGLFHARQEEKKKAGIVEESYFLFPLSIFLLRQGQSYVRQEKDNEKISFKVWFSFLSLSSYLFFPLRQGQSHSNKKEDRSC